MSGIIRKKEPGEAWETVVDDGGGGGGSLSVQAGEGAPVEDVTSLIFAGGDGTAAVALEVSPGVASVSFSFNVNYPWVTVQTGPPDPTFLSPFVYDDTAVTGGLYAWGGGAYVKIGNVVA